MTHLLVIASPDLSGRGNLVALFPLSLPTLFCHCEPRFNRGVAISRPSRLLRVWLTLTPAHGRAPCSPLSISPCEGERNYLLPHWGRIKEGGLTPCYQFTRDLQLDSGPDSNAGQAFRRNDGNVCEEW